MAEPFFTEIVTTDGLRLPGLLYDVPHSKKICIYIHGNGSSSVFYSKTRNETYAKALEKKGISLLVFNNRGAHYIKSLTKLIDGVEERKRYGMAYEIIKECLIDIDSAVDFLKEKGYDTFYLMGHSTGANKICVYNHYKKENEIKKYILLSGGDDTGIYFQMVGQKKCNELLSKAKEKIKQGKGEEIIKTLIPEIFFSYQSFYDTVNPDGDYNTFPFYEKKNHIHLSTKPLFRYFTEITKPSLVVYGTEDEYTSGSAIESMEILKKYNPQLDYALIEGADHGFTDHQEEVSQTCADWLANE